MTTTKIRVPRGYIAVTSDSFIEYGDDFVILRSGHIYRSHRVGEYLGKNPERGCFYIRRRTRKKGGGK